MQEMSMCPSKPRECQAEPGKEEKCGGTGGNHEKKDRFPGGKIESKREKDDRALGVERNAEDPPEGDQDEPHNEVIFPVGNRASKQGPEQLVMMMVVLLLILF